MRLFLKRITPFLRTSNFLEGNFLSWWFCNLLLFKSSSISQGFIAFRKATFDKNRKIQSSQFLWKSCYFTSKSVVRSSICSSAMVQLKIRLIAVQRKHIELLQIFAQALVQLKITFMHIFFKFWLSFHLWKLNNSKGDETWIAQ